MANMEIKLTLDRLHVCPLVSRLASAGGSRVAKRLVRRQPAGEVLRQTDAAAEDAEETQR